MSTSIDKLKELAGGLAVVIPALLALWRAPERWELILLLGVIVLLILRDRAARLQHQDCRAAVTELTLRCERMQTTLGEFYRALQDTRGNRQVDFPDFGDIMSGRAVFRWNHKPIPGGRRQTDPPKG